MSRISLKVDYEAYSKWYKELTGYETPFEDMPFYCESLNVYDDCIRVYQALNHPVLSMSARIPINFLNIDLVELARQNEQKEKNESN